MAETIYTIPINEAFEAGMESEAPECPFCKLYARLENNELELIVFDNILGHSNISFNMCLIKYTTVLQKNQ